MPYRIRLRVWKSREPGLYLPWRWIVKVDGRPVANAWAPTWGAALAIGRAALEHHHLPA